MISPDVALHTLSTALDQLEVAICVFDDEDRTVLWNDTFLQFFPEHAGHVHAGEPYQENLRRFYLQRLSQDELPSMERYIAEGVLRHRSQQRPYEFDHYGYRVRVASLPLGGIGRVRLWRKTQPLLTGMPDRLNPKGAPLPGCISLDTAMALESLADGVLMVDGRDQAVWANHAFLMLYGLPSITELARRTFDEIYAAAWQGEELTPDHTFGLATLKERQRFSGAPYELALPQDRWVRIVELRGTQANGSSFFSHMDITESRRQQEELRQLTLRLETLSVTDALTGLANRRRFDEVLEAEWRRAQRSGTTLALLMMDVDHFKHLNDTHGHPFGDEVLKKVACVLAERVQRSGSLVARYGGEEFAVLLPGTDAQAARELAESIRQVVQDQTHGNERTGPVGATISIGVACASDVAFNASSAMLVDMADRALYEAKRRGRNQVGGA